jgi:hypothetical protein
LHGLAKRHGISRNLSAFGLPRRKPASSTTILRRRVGELALENEFLKGLHGTLASRQAEVHPS